METLSIVTVLKTCLAMSAIWVLIYWFWNPYRVDEFRQRLFGLRHELFGFAAARGVSFTEPAYQELRLRINGMIRFAHRVTFARFILGTVLLVFGRDAILLRPGAEWQTKLRAVASNEAKAKLSEIHSKMTVLMIGHLLSGSPFLWLLIGIMLIASVVRMSTRKLLEGLAELPGLRSGLEALEAQAVN